MPRTLDGNTCHRPGPNTDFRLKATNGFGLSTSFIGRKAEISAVGQLLAANRVVTLTGADGVGKTRLAIEVAGQAAGQFGDGQWFVDLGSITEPDIVPIAVVHALGLPDQPGCSTIDTLLRCIGERRMLVVLDNCEHLLDSCAELVFALLSACPAVTFLATSREPIGVAGEATWRVSSLWLAGEAIELFTDRAGLVQPGFRLNDDNAQIVSHICRRLDGIPLAIELVAARVRALSVTEIAGSLADYFRPLTGAISREQTLRASLKWSYALLTESERILLRRLSVFTEGFDLAAAQAVGADSDIERFQVLGQLIPLVEACLVRADDSGPQPRYRLLEVVRQYALEKLVESPTEARAVHARRRSYYSTRINTDIAEP